MNGCGPGLIKASSLPRRGDHQVCIQVGSLTLQEFALQLRDSGGFAPHFPHQIACAIPLFAEHE